MECPENQERTHLLCEMVKSYMEIIDITILDMIPKYIIMSLVQAVSESISPAIPNLHPKSSSTPL